jgi:hypothetical protein
MPLIIIIFDNFSRPLNKKKHTMKIKKKKQTADNSTYNSIHHKNNNKKKVLPL